MTESITDNRAASDRKLIQWLFRPFRFVAGYKALLLGLGIILASAFFGFLGNTHFDGVLDVHIGRSAPLWLFIAEGIVDWLSLAIPLFFFGLILSPSALRMIDVFGTQALARWPYLITSVVMLPEANRMFSAYLMARLAASAGFGALNYVDLCIFAFAGFVSVLMVVWSVALMYQGYAISCNIKGAKAIVTFVVSIIGAEVLSKSLVLLLLR